MKAYMRKLVYGIGINDADYDTNIYVNRKLISTCKFHQTWRSMISRCYSTTFQNKAPTYVGCTVCKEWLSFMNFKAWMETQDWEGKELDKDLIFKGNKHYSPETCFFISAIVNSFISLTNSRNDLPVGVQQNRNKDRYISNCAMLGNGRKHLGTFDTIEEASNAYIEFKKLMAIELAASQTDPRIAELILCRYSD